MADGPKLHIDDDWKSEAQAEKERLADQVEQAGPMGDEGPLPPADFRALVNLLAMQALVGLGGMREPGGGMIPPSPELAKMHIDLLEVLESKTKGNLTDDEKKAIETTLYHLRLGYVQLMSGPPGGMPAPGAPRKP